MIAIVINIQIGLVVAFPLSHPCCSLRVAKTHLYVASRHLVNVLTFLYSQCTASLGCARCAMHIRARTTGPPGQALWHEPSRQIGRASDDVQAFFYAQPSAGMPGSCMAREWKKGRLGRPPHAPLSVCASSMSPVASRGGIAVQSLARGIGSAGEAILVLNNTRVRTECSRLICIPTYL